MNIIGHAIRTGEVLSLLSAEMTCMHAGVSSKGAWRELAEYVVGNRMPSTWLALI